MAGRFYGSLINDRALGLSVGSALPDSACRSHDRLHDAVIGSRRVLGRGLRASFIGRPRPECAAAARFRGQTHRQEHRRAGRFHRPLRCRRHGRFEGPCVGLSRQGSFRRWRARQEGRPSVHDRPETLPGCPRRREGSGGVGPSQLRFHVRRFGTGRQPDQIRQYHRAGGRPAPSGGALVPCDARSSPGGVQPGQTRHGVHRDPIPPGGPHLAEVGFGRQSHQRQRHAAQHDRLARPDPVLLRRRRTLVPRLPQRPRSRGRCVQRGGPGR